MGRTACTERQCLYKGALYLYTVNQNKGLQISPYKTDENYMETEFYTPILPCWISNVERENRLCSKLILAAGKLEEEEDDIECWR